MLAQILIILQAGESAIVETKPLQETGLAPKLVEQATRACGEILVETYKLAVLYHCYDQDLIL